MKFYDKLSLGLYLECWKTYKNTLCRPSYTNFGGGQLLRSNFYLKYANFVIISGQFQSSTALFDIIAC